MADSIYQSKPTSADGSEETHATTGRVMLDLRSKVQRMPIGAAPVAAPLEDRRGAAQPDSSALPAQLQSGIEALSGIGMDHVRVHYNSSAPAQLHAHAYAQGSAIHLGPGQEEHLPHEAWHVVQQAQGRVRPTVQMKGGALLNDDAGLEMEADVMGARAMNTVTDHAQARQLANGVASSGSAVQRVRMEAEVSGLTHLVASVGGSLYNGEEGPEVAHGTPLQIDTDDRILSRRGPNQEVHGEADRLGKQVYTWVRVLAIGDRMVLRPEYIREDAINNILPLPPGLEVVERRQRQQAPDGRPQARRPASIWFRKEDVLSACGVIEKKHPDPARTPVNIKQVTSFIRDLPPQTVESTPTALRGLEGFHDILHHMSWNRSLPPRQRIIADAILVAAQVSINDVIAAQVEPDSLHRDWYHDFAGTLAMLAERKDLSELAISKLLKFHLMQHQVQAPYGDDAMKRSGRKASPLLSEDYARGMRTRLWSVASEIGLSDLITHLFGSSAPHPGEDKKAHDNRTLRTRQLAKKFKTKFYVVAAPAPFQIGPHVPVVLGVPPPEELLAVDSCTYVHSLKLQIVPIGLVAKKTVDSHMGGRGQRSSPSESASMASVAMARLIKAGKIAEALALIEPQFREGTAKGEKNPLSRIQFDSRMLIAPLEFTPGGRWRDPLLSSTQSQLKGLVLAYAALKSAVPLVEGTPFLFIANLQVFDNLVGGNIAHFFNAQTPAQVTASLTDTLETAAKWAADYGQIKAVSAAPDVVREAFSRRKLCLDHYYQAMQSLHEAVRFQLSWHGTDPRILEQGILHMLPRSAPPATSVHASPHGLGMIGQIHHALGKTKNVGVLKHSYYETPGIFDGPHIAPGVQDAQLLAQDLIVLEPHPNNAEDRGVIPHEPLRLLAALANGGRHHTVMMDVTLNHLREQEIVDILDHAAPLIKDGRLNLILMQSGTKFLQHGMDIASLGIGVVFNNEKNWIEFNKAMAATPQATPADDTAYLGHMLMTNRTELGAYLDHIRANTGMLKQLLHEKLGSDGALEVTVSSDDKTVYVAIAPTAEFVHRYFPGNEHAAMNYAYKLILKEMADLSLVARPSFGFNLTNLGECLTTIRITPGIEGSDMLIAYARGLEAADEKLKAGPAQL